MLYAAKHYNNKAATTSEFVRDYAKLQQIRKTFNNYRKNKKLNIRLLLNQIVIFSNLFGVNAATKMLLCETDYIEHSALIPILVFLGYVGEEDLCLHTVEFDSDVVTELRGLK